MAFNAVSQVAPQPDVVTTKGRKGGGKFGQALGAVAGGVVGGMASGGMGAMKGAAVGASLGAMAGEAIRPSREGSTTAIERRLGAGPQIQSDNSDKLKQAVLALHSAPDDVRSEYAKPLVTAYMTSVAQKYT